MNNKQGLKSRLSKFISSHRGQTFFNFAYSIGAAIVIWGVLFQLLHLPGSEILLSIGLGTEVIMFIITAFDIPPRNYNWESVFPALDGEDGPQELQHGGSSVSDENTRRLIATLDCLEHAVSTMKEGTTVQADNTVATSTPVNSWLADRAEKATLEYCEQAEQLTSNMRRLNEIYTNMLSALDRSNQNTAR